MLGRLIFKLVQALVLNRIFFDVQILADELNHCSGMSRNAMERIVGYCLKFRQEKCIDSEIRSSELVWGHLYGIFVTDGQVDEAIISAYKIV